MISNVGATCTKCHEHTVVLTVERIYGSTHVEVARQHCECVLTGDDIDDMYEEMLEVESGAW